MRWRAELAALLLLGGCGTTGALSDRPVKIGQPYAVGGVRYVPEDRRDYDAVGYASWYGRDHAGKPTANGERFDPGALTAAHPTLPMPSYVAVTALDSGRTITVRVNDRGPFSRGKLIDLSRAAARMLGTEAAGDAPVRVRRVYPTAEQQRAVARGRRVAMLPEPTPGERAEQLRRLAAQPHGGLAPAGAPVAADAAPEGGQGAAFIRVASFASRANADGLAAVLGGSVVAAGRYWQVRLGPYTDGAAAARSLANVVAKGYRDASVVAAESW
ncbi:septal ring lytic transglycosylase RlpA family protein [Sphingomonas flavalba]|uniref:septal ring lytic transglycosylase RlpA family protein n=1 Tax=Sphingomonas flavalba TaxID=2559804 RepID=UPI00109DEF49|nr:septal ring lytic transglycosylase RlpA family protein [Sphingomonas flavalba]